MSSTKPPERIWLAGTPTRLPATSRGPSPAMSLRATCTMRTHASQEVACACVMAETARTSSSVASVNASGRMRIRDPLPLSRSPVRPRPEENASAVVPPMSKRPLTVYAPSRYQRTKRSRMSRTSMRPVARMLSQLASDMEVSSLQVPAGWL